MKPSSHHTPVPQTEPAGGWFHRYMQRHQHPLSQMLHAVGIPLTVLAVVLAGVQLAQWRWDLWWRPTVLLLIGYALQWIGHRIEGNDMGEIILIKRLRGKPYTAISPRYTNRPSA